MFETVLEKKPRFAVIFAAGFTEVGPEGEALQQRLEDLIATGSTHLLGPNTNLNAFETFRDDLPAPKIALITQSGHQGRPVFQAQEQGIALSHWAPAGNEADLEFADFARTSLDQPDGRRDRRLHRGLQGRPHADAGRRPRGEGRHADRVREGRAAPTKAVRWPSPHGHLTGSDRVISDVFRQFGVTRVDGLDELTDVAAMFARTPVAPAPGPAPRSAAVCVYAISGGTGAHMADLVAAAGMQLPDLDEVDPEEAARAHPRLPTGVEPGRHRWAAHRPTSAGPRSCGP